MAIAASAESTAFPPAAHALAAGGASDIGTLVADEFHYYGDPQRGWAWQVPLIELPQAQFLLMSATLGDVTRFDDRMRELTGRETAVVDDAERMVVDEHGEQRGVRQQKFVGAAPLAVGG